MNRYLRIVLRLATDPGANYPLYKKRFREKIFLLRKKYFPGVPFYANPIPGLTVAISPREQIAESIYMGDFEPEVMAYFLRTIKPGMVIFDVGANIGYFTTVLANLAGKDGAVHAFEPSLREFKSVSKTIKKNGQNNVVLNQTALSEKTGRVTMNIAKTENMAALNTMGNITHPAAHEGDFQKIEVPLDTIDNYVVNKDLKRLDLIKIDVEGAELMVLKGAEKTLKKYGPQIICEFSDLTTKGFGYQAKEIFEWLVQKGYRAYRINNQGDILIEPGKEHYDYDNLLFIMEAL